MTNVKMPEPVVWRSKYKSEPGMIGNYPWSYAEHSLRQTALKNYDIESLITTTQAQAYADERVKEACDWHPIETAPKDGRTLLLGFFNLCGKWRTMRGNWMSEDYISEHWLDPDEVAPGWFETSVEADDVPNCWSINPTHWMPLPPPPPKQSTPA